MLNRLGVPCSIRVNLAAARRFVCAGALAVAGMVFTSSGAFAQTEPTPLETSITMPDIGLSLVDIANAISNFYMEGLLALFGVALLVRLLMRFVRKAPATVS